MEKYRSISGLRFAIATIGAYIIVGFAVLAFLFLVLFGVWASYSYFAPKYVEVDNAVFKQSTQYNDGMIRDLEELQMAYIKAEPDQKAALKAVILHRFSVYPIEKLPPNLRSFYEELSRQ